MSKSYKLIQLAQEVYLIPKIRRYLLSSNKVSRVKLEGLIHTYLNFNDNKAFKELVDSVILIAETDRAFLD